MRYEDKEGGRPKETEKERHGGKDGKTYRKKREKETRERQKRETERAVNSEFGRNE